MISERLKILREEKGLTKKEVANSLEMPYTTYVNYENGSREPGSDFLIEVSKYYNVTIDYIIGISDIRNHEFSKADNFNKGTINYVMGENGKREVRYSDSSTMENEKDNDTLLAEMGVKRTNYIISKKNERTELSDNEYNFLINSLELFRKK